MKAKWLDRDLLAGNYMTLCTTDALFQEALKRLGIKETVEFMGKGYACHHEFVTPRGMYSSIVCIKLNPERTGIETAAMIAHEAVHVWHSSRRAIGEDKPGEEVEAYAIQSIVGRLLQEYQRQTQ